MIELAEKPSFLLLNSTGKDFIVNQKLIRLLKYTSIDNFYNQVDNFFKIIDPCNLQRFRTRMDEMLPDEPIKKYPYHLININACAIHCMVGIKSVMKSDSPVWFGYVNLKNERRTVHIDPLILNFFNNDKFLDETMIIMDFKGNILTTNRKLNMINFFADFTDKSSIFSVV
jgi:hypothetical protein